jgi:hypothetical protein
VQELSRFLPNDDMGGIDWLVAELNRRKRNSWSAMNDRRRSLGAPGSVVAAKAVLLECATGVDPRCIKICVSRFLALVADGFLD